MLALAAGADLLCIGADVRRRARSSSVAADIAAADRPAGALAGARVEEAAARRPGARPTGPGPRPSPRPRIDPRLGYAAARRAVRVEGIGQPGSRRRSWSSSSRPSTIAEGRVPWGLGPHLNGTEQMPASWPTTSTRRGAHPGRAGGRPIVLVGPAHPPLPGARDAGRAAGRARTRWRSSRWAGRRRGGRPARGRSSPPTAPATPTAAPPPRSSACAPDAWPTAARLPRATLPRPGPRALLERVQHCRTLRDDRKLNAFEKGARPWTTRSGCTCLPRASASA